MPLTRKPLAALGLTAAAAVGGSFFVSGVAAAASTPATAPVGRISVAVPAAGHLVSLTNSPTPAAAPAPAAPAAAPVAAVSSYTVVSGDSLWAISQRFGVSLTTLASGNGMNLHDILPVGKVLTIPTGASATSTSASSEDSDSSASSSTSASEATETSDDSGSSSTSSHESSSSSAAPSSSFESCVINSESGGDPDVTNSSGHYGLYQFSKSTWEEYGGSASSFGDASAAEQHEVFSRAVADGGSSNWSSYDGC